MKLRRNRIVVDLDKARADQQGRVRARRSGRAGRILGIIAVGLVLIIMGVAAGGYFWWRHYQSSPAYSLALLADASQRNDTATIDSILDIEKISADFVSQVRQRLPGSSTPSLWPAPLDSARTSLSTKLKETVHEQLMKELKELTDGAAGKPFVIIALAVPRFADIKQENNTALVTVNIKEEQIKLTMQADGDRWRITAVQDEKLAKLVADSMIRSVPANGSQLQDSIERQLDKVQKR
jgi:hypothetical protein